MRTIPHNNSIHQFEKQNLVTVEDRRGPHDVLQCSKCGMKGKIRSFGTIEVSSSYSAKRVNGCDGKTTIRKIRIRNFRGVNPAFDNLTEGSEHEVIEAPEGKDSDRGFWVQGVGEPVLVLLGEYELVARA